MTVGAHRGARCWFEGRGAGGCHGQLERAHWIKQQVLRRELDALHTTCPRCGARPGEPCLDAGWSSHAARGVAIQELVWDPRVWTFMCTRHHRQLDHARTLRVARADLPLELEAFAREHDALLRAEPLGAWLDMEYGPIESEAA